MVLVSIGEQASIIFCEHEHFDFLVFQSSTSSEHFEKTLVECLLNIMVIQTRKGILKNIYLCVELALEYYDARTKYKQNSLGDLRSSGEAVTCLFEVPKLIVFLYMHETRVLRAMGEGRFAWQIRMHQLL